MDALAGVKLHRGWTGAFTQAHADGCFPNMARIVKTQSQPGDMTPVGTRGRVLGSLCAPGVGAGYFVEWDGLPKVAVFVMASKIEEAV